MNAKTDKGLLLMGEPEATAEQAAAHYLGLGAGCVVVKQGSRGAYFDDGETHGWGTVYPAKQVATAWARATDLPPARSRASWRACRSPTP